MQLIVAKDLLYKLLSNILRWNINPLVSEAHYLWAEEFIFYK